MTRPSQTRSRILDGTATAVLERGVSATTVQHILGEADVSRRTFYQYFRNKEDALTALYEDTATRLLAGVAARVSETEDPLEKIVEGVEAYLDHQEKGGPLLWALQREAIHPGSPLHAIRARSIEAFVQFIDTQFQQVADLKVDPLLYRGMILGIDGVVRHLQGQGQYGPKERERVSQMARPVIVNVLSTVPQLPDYTD